MAAQLEQVELVPNMSLIFLRVDDITTHPERNSLYKRSIKKPDHPFIATNKPGSNSSPIYWYSMSPIWTVGSRISYK